MSKRDFDKDPLTREEIKMLGGFQGFHRIPWFSKVEITEGAVFIVTDY